MMARYRPDQHLRTVRLHPFRPGHGPIFTLTIWDTYKRSDQWGRAIVAYRFTMSFRGERTVLFEGDDFKPSPMYAVDSDEAVRNLLGFLSLRPGDTDDEYFKDYTDVQRDFAELYAEHVQCAVIDRFGE